MTMIYFTGYLDHWGEDARTNLQLGNKNPVIARGYDTSGNCVEKIRFGEIVAEKTTIGDYVSWAYEAYTEKGALTQFDGPFPYPLAEFIAVAKDGTVYITFAKNNVSFHDFFRVYHRNGDRVSFPRIITEWWVTGGIALSPDDDFIYIGGQPNSTDQSMLRKYNSKTGELVWSKSMQLPDLTDGGVSYDICSCLTVDLEGNIYCGCYNPQGYGSVEYNSQGYWLGGASLFGIVGTEEVFTYTHGANTIRKYDSDGNLLFTIYPLSGAPTTKIVVDNNGSIYSTLDGCWGYFTSPTAWVETVPLFSPTEIPHCIFKWDASNGSYLSSGWDCKLFDMAWDGASLCIYYSRLDFASSDPYFPAGFARLNADYSVQIPRKIYDYLSRLTADNGIAYLGLRSQIVVQPATQTYIYGSYETFDNDNADLWYGKTGTSDPGVNGSGVIWRDYRSTLSDTSYYEPLYNSLEIDTYINTKTAPDLVDNQSGWVTRNCVVVKNTQFDSISLPALLTIPSWVGDRYNQISGIPVTFSFGNAAYLRDYVGPVRPVVYRLYLTGTPDIELKISSLSIRRSITSRSLSVVASLESGGQMAAIEARASGDLVLKRGVKLGSGIEQLDELLRVPFDGMRFDEGPTSLSASLDGKSVETSNAKTRVLTGISYRALQDGKRRIRCSVDTYIAPGDTADLGGGESIIIGELVYTVSAQSAIMECTEAAP